VGGLDALVAWTREHTSSDERAELMRAVTTAAMGNDRLACQLLERTGRRIARATVAFGRYLGLTDRPCPVLLTGKVWRAGAVLLDSFCRHITAGLPEAVCSLNALSQAKGAALLAMKHAGVAVGPEIYVALRSDPAR
jgi:N-acetylglucosamine kinase-like BadF-type ATPase